MNTEEVITPLLAWLRAATSEQRDRMAALAGTTTNYLYQCASPGGKRGKKLTADLAFRLEDAMATLEKESKGTLTAVTARELAAMWQEA
jgi:hypothetical protein